MTASGSRRSNGSRAVTSTRLSDRSGTSARTCSASVASSSTITTGTPVRCCWYRSLSRRRCCSWFCRSRNSSWSRGAPSRLSRCSSASRVGRGAPAPRRSTTHAPLNWSLNCRAARTARVVRPLPAGPCRRTTVGRTAVDARARCTHWAIRARCSRRPANGPSASGSWVKDCSSRARVRAAALRSTPADPRGGTGPGVLGTGPGVPGVLGTTPRGRAAAAAGPCAGAGRLVGAGAADCPATKGLMPCRSSADSHACRAAPAPAGGCGRPRRPCSAAAPKVAAPVAAPVTSAAPPDRPCPRSTPSDTTAATAATSPVAGPRADTARSPDPSRTSR